MARYGASTYGNTGYGSGSANAGTIGSGTFGSGTFGGAGDSPAPEGYTRITTISGDVVSAIVSRKHDGHPLALIGYGPWDVLDGDLFVIYEAFPGMFMEV